MSYSELRSYKVYAPCYWDKDSEEYICDIQLSSIPSKQDILNALNKAGHYSYPNEEYEKKLKIERPDGWCYKTILVLKTDQFSEIVWKIVPKT